MSETDRTPPHRSSAVPDASDARRPDATGSIYPDLRRAIFLLAALFLVYQLAGPISAILVLFLLVFIVAAVLNPAAAWLQERGVPRTLSAVGMVLLLIAALAGLAWLALPPLINELGSLVERFDPSRLRLTEYYAEFRARFPELGRQLPPPEELIDRVTPDLGWLLGRVGAYALNLAAGIFSLVVFLVLLIYTVGQPEPLVTGLLTAVPARLRAATDAALRNSMEQLKQWAIGSLIVGAVIGVATWIGLYLLGVPYAFLFGVIAAVGELIPVIGPIFAAIPPLLLALTIDPWTALWVLLFFVALQQVESNVLTPLVLGGKLELHPVSIIFAVLVLHSLLGILGALLAVPVTAILKVCWQEFYLKPRGVDRSAIEDRAESIVDSPGQTAGEGGPDAGEPDEEHPAGTGGAREPAARPEERRAA